MDEIALTGEVNERDSRPRSTPCATPHVQRPIDINMIPIHTCYQANLDADDAELFSRIDTMIVVERLEAIGAGFVDQEGEAIFFDVPAELDPKAAAVIIGELVKEARNRS